MKLISVYNIKGGVGKTATSVNIAYTASEDNNKVLLIDLDPQAASSFYLGAKPSKKQSGIFKDSGIDEEIQSTDYENLDILPANTHYRHLDSFISRMKNGDKWLKKILKPVKKQYDYIIIDCPPNITALSENLLRNTDAVLVPVIPTVLSVRTYEQLKKFFVDEKIDRKKLHPFFSMVERRKHMHLDTMEAFSRIHPECLKVLIPYNAEVEKMGEYMAPIVKKYPYAEVSENFRKLWKKLKQKM